MSTPDIERFVEGGAKLRAACEGLSREDLVARPGPGAWSILELVIHLQDMEVQAVQRMKAVIAEENPTLLNANENLWVEKLAPHEQSLEDAIAIIDLTRRQVARTLRGLPPEAFDRYGTHNLRGKLTLGGLVTGYTKHLEHHLGFLLEKRQRLGKPVNR